MYPNQYQPYPAYNQMPFQAMQKQEIIKVNGENGANAINLAPNSSMLALDVNNPIVWLVQSDGAGYKTVTPYDIVPHVTVTLEERIARLEKAYEPHTTTNEQPKQEPIKPTDPTGDV